jgi:hypothetical protein
MREAVQRGFNLHIFWSEMKPDIEQLSIREHRRFPIS